MPLKSQATTPSDFPKDQALGAVSGVQPKLTVRKVGDTYVHGLTAEELYERYDACVDLVNQLSDYCQRKLDADPNWRPEDLLQRVRTAVEGRNDWDFSQGEVDWTIRHVAMQMSWP